MNAGGNMHEPGAPRSADQVPPETTELQDNGPDMDALPSFGRILCTIFKYICILIGGLIVLVILGLFVLYLVCAFG